MMIQFVFPSCESITDTVKLIEESESESTFVCILNYIGTHDQSIEVERKKQDVKKLIL